jgi:hypothetical protein
MPDQLWLPLVAVAVVCAGAGYVVGYLTKHVRTYNRGQADGVALGWEARGQARHEGALHDWQRERAPQAWAAAQEQEGRRGA